MLQCSSPYRSELIRKGHIPEKYAKKRTKRLVSFIINWFFKKSFSRRAPRPPIEKNLSTKVRIRLKIQRCIALGPTLFSSFEEITINDNSINALHQRKVLSELKVSKVYQVSACEEENFIKGKVSDIVASFSSVNISCSRTPKVCHWK